MHIRVHAISIGRPQIVLRGGRQYSTAINRRPVEGPIEMTTLGLAGDRVSDDAVHGGPDKAVCCYPHEHYAFWKDQLGTEPEIPTFGENFTTVGLLEHEVCMGDVFRIGSATVQISQPRGPCFKLAHKLNYPNAILTIHETGYSGFYFRVCAGGRVRAGDDIVLQERRHSDLTVARLLQLKQASTVDAELATRLAALPELAQSMRESFAKKISAMRSA